MGYGLLRALLGEPSRLPPSPSHDLWSPTRAWRQTSGRQDHTTSPSALVLHVSSTFASTAFRPTFVTTRTPLVSGRNDEKNTSEYQQLQETNLRQNGTTGKLRMIDMRNLPVVHSQAHSGLSNLASSDCRC